MPDSQYYALLVVDIENWGGRPAVVQVALQATLRYVMRNALASVGLSADEVRTTSRGDGAIIALSAGVPKETVTTRLVRAIDDRVREYDMAAAAGSEMRLRVALHAGDVHDGGDEWAGEAVVTACRLVDSEVLHRVLTAADRAVVALVVSDQWYRSVVGGGWVPASGFEQVWPVVKDYAEPAWVRVPTYDRPPGLRPGDQNKPAQDRGQSSAPVGAPGNSDLAQGHSFGGDLVQGHKFGGDLVQGNKNVTNNWGAAR